jgi:hypothetical protein
VKETAALPQTQFDITDVLKKGVALNPNEKYI